MDNVDFKSHYPGTMASIRPCQQTYRGEEAASELEVKAVSGFIEHLGAPFRAFMSLHSYGQMVISPWGYGKKKPLDYRHMVIRVGGAII